LSVQTVAEETKLLEMGHGNQTQTPVVHRKAHETESCDTQILARCIWQLIDEIIRAVKQAGKPSYTKKGMSPVRRTRTTVQKQDDGGHRALNRSAMIM
jgi:hypothetical protein